MELVSHYDHQHRQILNAEYRSITAATALTSFIDAVKAAMPGLQTRILSPHGAIAYYPKDPFIVGKLVVYPDGPSYIVESDNIQHKKYWGAERHQKKSKNIETAVKNARAHLRRVKPEVIIRRLWHRGEEQVIRREKELREVLSDTTHSIFGMRHNSYHHEIMEFAQYIKAKGLLIPEVLDAMVPEYFTAYDTYTTLARGTKTLSLVMEWHNGDIYHRRGRVEYNPMNPAHITPLFMLNGTGEDAGAYTTIRELPEEVQHRVAALNIISTPQPQSTNKTFFMEDVEGVGTVIIELGIKGYVSIHEPGVFEVASDGE